MHPLPSLADCHLNQWTVWVHCARCNSSRQYVQADLEDISILRPRMWDQPLDVAMPKFRCLREKSDGRCAGKADLIVVRRMQTGGLTEDVLRLAQS